MALVLVKSPNGRLTRPPRGTSMPISRRDVLNVTTAAGATGLMPLSAAQAGAAAAPPSGKQAVGVYRYKVGDLEVTAINDGIAERPLEGFIKNAELADVRKALSDAFLPVDKMRITFTTLVINDGSKLVL